MTRSWSLTHQVNASVLENWDTRVLFVVATLPEDQRLMLRRLVEATVDLPIFVAVSHVLTWPREWWEDCMVWLDAGGDPPGRLFKQRYGVGRYHTQPYLEDLA